MLEEQVLAAWMKSLGYWVDYSSFDRQVDFTSVHKTLRSQKKKEEEKLKYASTRLQVSYQFVSIFPFCCLATLQELRIQIGGHHESFCVFWNLFFTQNKLSVYTEIKVWNISNWKILNTEMELVAKHVFLVSVNISLSSIFLRCYQHDIFFSVIYFWWL